MKCKTGARFLPNTSIVSFILIRFIGLGVVAKLGPFERKEMLSLENDSYRNWYQIEQDCALLTWSSLFKTNLLDFLLNLPDCNKLGLPLFNIY